MQRKTITSLLCTGILALLSSCAPRIYVPVRNPTPLFRNKGDLYIDVSYKPASSAELTAGYAISDNFAGYAGVSASSIYTTSYYKEYVHGDVNNAMANIGMGFYRNQRKSDRYRVEGFLDLAGGNYNLSEYDIDYRGGQPQYFSGNMKRVSFLLNFANTNIHKSFTYGYSMRFGNVFFSNNTFSHDDYWSKFIYMANLNNHLFLDHALFGKIGRGAVKFQFQIAFYHCMNNGPLSGSGGVVFGIVINPNIFGTNKTFYDKDNSPVSD